METILYFAPELAADPAALAQFEDEYNAWLDALDAVGLDDPCQFQFSQEATQS